MRREKEPWHLRSWDQTPPLAEDPGPTVDVSQLSFFRCTTSFSTLYKASIYGCPAVSYHSFLCLFVLSGRYVCIYSFLFLSRLNHGEPLTYRRIGYWQAVGTLVAVGIHWHCSFFSLSGVNIFFVGAI